MSFEKFLRAVHADPAISWRTTAPYDLGDVEIVRIGFAGDPVVQVIAVVSHAGEVFGELERGLKRLRRTRRLPCAGFF